MKSHIFKLLETMYEILKPKYFKSKNLLKGKGYFSILNKEKEEDKIKRGTKIIFN